MKLFSQKIQNIRLDGITRERLMSSMQELTDLENPNSVTQMKTWLSDNGIETETLGKKAVPQSVYKGEKSMEVCSTRLCQILTAMFQWNPEYSYRVPGVILPQKELVLFYLANAEVIERKE